MVQPCAQTPSLSQAQGGGIEGALLVVRDILSNGIGAERTDNWTDCKHRRQ